MPLNMMSSSPSCTSDSRDQSSASRPLSSGLAAHRKTRVFLERLYPSLFTCSVNENMLAAVFSNVSKETLGLYRGAVGEATDGDRDDTGDMVSIVGGDDDDDDDELSGGEREASRDVLAELADMMLPD